MARSLIIWIEAKTMPGDMSKPDHWLILRTSNRHTLDLADALNGNGLSAWTPQRNVLMRKASWNAPREIRQPLMPSYVFARAGDVDSLATHSLDLPPFGFFCHQGEIRFVPDFQLEPLRAAEKTELAMARDQYWLKGDEVLVLGGIFGGMNGIVERGHAETPTIRFGSRMRVKISALLLDRSKANSSKSVPDARTGSSLFGR